MTDPNSKETTMTTYTAEDFANAEFARHPDGRIAARVDSGDSMPWRVATGSWISDADMADLGWMPVREAADQPTTLDALRRVWETAEQANECNEGDTLIHRHSGSRRKLEVWVANRPGPLSPYTRILHRAPKPKRPEGAKQLEALLDEWGDLTRSEEPTPLADWLAERGVTVSKNAQE